MKNRQKTQQQVKSQYASGYRPADLDFFEPLEVKVRGPGREAFEDSIRIFKSVVQKEKILSLYKEKQQFEKPSIKKRRKAREAQERKLSMELKQALIKNGEWDKRIKKKQARRQKRSETVEQNEEW